ncbi:MAG: hypothetical protein N2484_04385 [Clostridia bacterium]|nr:hypothetical protein [Clostridia bacterium]
MLKMLVKNTTVKGMMALARNLDELKEQAKKNLCKGVRVLRFRRTKTWKVINRYLYGLMFAEDMKIAELAALVKVRPRTVAAWIYEGTIPKQETREKVCEILSSPETVLFNEEEIKARKNEFYKK